jgi:hypothetical protein
VGEAEPMLAAFIARSLLRTGPGATPVVAGEASAASVAGETLVAGASSRDAGEAGEAAAVSALPVERVQGLRVGYGAGREPAREGVEAAREERRLAEGAPGVEEIEDGLGAEEGLRSEKARPWWW